MNIQRQYHRISKTCLIYVLIISLLASLLSFYTYSSHADESYDLPWLWPVPDSYEINGLDYYYSGNPHGAGTSIDIGANGYTGLERLDVVSATGGEVFYIRDVYNETDDRGSGWGNYVIVKSGDIYIVYGHLQSVSCTYGKIEPGDVIGKMGATGNASGVHLHLQAYPVNESTNSTSVYAFDNYLYNPYYYSKFKFCSGIEKYSLRYGEHISNYYKNLSGSYYSYSGGFTPSYGQDDLGATVTSVRVTGARVYSSPDNLTQPVDFISYLSTVDVIGVYKDPYGKLWYLLSDSEDRWVSQTDVAFNSYKFGVECSDISFPNAIYASFYNLNFEGKFKTNNTIVSLKAEIISEGNVVASHEYHPNSNVFNVENRFYNDLTIVSMADGKYTVVVTITEKAEFPGADPEIKTYKAYSSDFEISNVLADKIKPALDNIKIESITDDLLKLSVVASDNDEIARVIISVSSDDGSFTKKYTPIFANERYYLEVNIGDLPSFGNYVIEAIAYDWYNNLDNESINVYIPQAPEGEKWRVQVSDSLSIRSGPGTSYNKLGRLYNGNIVTITEGSFNASNNMHWGKIPQGWISLDYTVYLSGFMHNVSFNFNGGSSDMVHQLNKRYSIPVTIPNDIPERNGYKFIGWSTDPLATEAQYEPGDSYTDDKNINLFAIWEDKELPIISSVDVSTTEYTADGVVITVNASDNTAKVYYSFDGGLSWTSSSSITINENITLSAGSIVVRDDKGNRAVYGTDVVISNIDDIPPKPSDSDVKISVTGSDVKVEFDEASDELSGVDHYEFVYAHNSDASLSVSSTLKSGDSFTLANGVYSCYLNIYDKVGNVTKVNVKRFVVGPKSQLSAPESFSVVETSNERVVFDWNDVTDSDLYIIEISETSDFSDLIVFESNINSISITALQSGKYYYARVLASSTDSIFIDSEYSQVVRFETVSSDNTVYSVKNVPDAIIKGTSISIVAPYVSQTIDLTLIVHKRATYNIYTDIALANKINPASISNVEFNENSFLYYVEVIAENGDRAIYTINVNRASYAPEIPSVEYDAFESQLFVSQSGNELLVNATVSDGGILSVLWYAVYNDGTPYVVSDTFEYTPQFNHAGVYRVYAVVTNTNEKCYETTASFTTEEAHFTVVRKSSGIKVECNDFVYSAVVPSPEYSDYEGNGNVVYKYYSDVTCNTEIDPPTDAGIYYVKAFASQTDMYEASVSEASAFEIIKADNHNLPEYIYKAPSLRDRYGYVTIDSDGVEYSIDGGEYRLVLSGDIIKLSEGDVITLRFSQTHNYNASNDVVLTVDAYSGTDDFYLNDTIDMQIKEQYLYVNEDELFANDLISGFTKTDSIVVFDPSGNVLSDAEFVYTSCVISIVDELGIFKSLTVIILGDVDYNGVVDYNDVDKILCISNGMTQQSSEFELLSGDINGDGELTSDDSYFVYVKTK